MVIDVVSSTKTIIRQGGREEPVGQVDGLTRTRKHGRAPRGGQVMTVRFGAQGIDDEHGHRDASYCTVHDGGPSVGMRHDGREKPVGPVSGGCTLSARYRTCGRVPSIR